MLNNNFFGNNLKYDIVDWDSGGGYSSSYYRKPEYRILDDIDIKIIEKYLRIKKIEELKKET